MDLAGYFKEKGLLNDSDITTVTNNYMAHKYTFFEELYTNGDKYGVDEDTLFQALVEVGGHGYEVITTTRAFNTEYSDYAKLGGVNVCSVRKILCLRQSGNPVCILTQRPDDNTVLPLLNKAFGVGQFTFGVCNKALWKSFMQIYFEPLSIEAQAQSITEKENKAIYKDSAVKDSESRSLYCRILNQGIAYDASDIHIRPGVDACRIQYRIDGENRTINVVPNKIVDRIYNLLLVDGKIAVTQQYITIDGKLKYYPNGKIDSSSPSRDLRFSIMPGTWGPDIVIRLLNNKPFSFDELGMTESNVELYKRVLQMPQGLVVQVGPTGSGKSTTMYAGVRWIRDNTSRNVITAEDPVEIYMDGITQVSVREATKLTYAQIARQFLRHDVDVGVIGEIRDEETAVEAVRAATTGHLILSSLHTNDSLGVIERLIRLGVEPYTLSEVIVAIMGQRLLRRLCPHCKEAVTYDADDERIRSFGFKQKEGKITFYKPGRCEKCKNIGYKGRIAVNEILVIDRELRDMIQRHETRKTMEKYLESIKWQTMYSDAQEKVLAGISSLEELEKMRSDILAFK